jgi:hypothetical protein
VPEPTAAGRPGIVVVSYNTRRLTAQLLYSLYRTLQPPAFHLVVVDNGSTDGSAELLSAAAEAGLCDLIRNPENRYHGPGLNQGMSRLVELRDRGAVPITAVWLLDSDCVVLRPDALSAPRGHARDRSGAGRPARLRHLGRGRAARPALAAARPGAGLAARHPAVPGSRQPVRGPATLLRPGRPGRRGLPLHPRRLHRPRRPRIPAGAPGRRRAEQPPLRLGHVHHEPHFALEPAAPAAYAAFQAAFARAVPTLDATSLVRACR